MIGHPNATSKSVVGALELRPEGRETHEVSD